MPRLDAKRPQVSSLGFKVSSLGVTAQCPRLGLRRSGLGLCRSFWVKGFGFSGFGDPSSGC